jgi:hypothetical protein
MPRRSHITLHDHAVEILPIPVRITGGEVFFDWNSGGLGKAAMKTQFTPYMRRN